MNRFAQLQYGQVIHIYETELSKEELTQIFAPNQTWFDVTGIECEVGYLSDGQIFWKPQEKQVDTNSKEYKLSKLKEEYLASTESLKSYLNLAILRDDNNLIAELKNEFAELQKSYEEQKGVIENA